MSIAPTDIANDKPVSVIIANFNYAAFIGAAIDSALALHWANVEVIVVDDGSHDGSREVIGSYGDKITAIFQENQGQVPACNRGLAASSGQWVIFLDSDDMLHPDLLQEAAKLWHPGVSKIQCQMLRVDAAGKSLEAISPQYKVKPDPELIREWVSTTSAYPTPPGSGNIYARWYLEELFPLDAGIWDFTDSPCLAAAPYFGDVETIIRPLVYYRIHGRNDSQMVSFDPRLAVRDIERAQRRFNYARKIAGEHGITVDSRAIFRSLSFNVNRIVSYRFAGDRHPIECDSRPRVFRDALRAATSSQGVTARSSLLLLLWIVLAALAPRRLAELLISWRFIPGSRPRSLAALLRRDGDHGRIMSGAGAQ